MIDIDEKNNKKNSILASFMNAVTLTKKLILQRASSGRVW